MKKLLVSFATAALLLVVIPSHANDATASATKTESAEVRILINRVNEIKAMDKSTLSFAEKKELRKELRGIKKEVNRRAGNAIYISGGLILLIVLLIILL